jgi:hypothetical protein
MGYLKKRLSIKYVLELFLICYLPIFSFGIFAPTEIFFANLTDFGVIFDEFGWKFLQYGTVAALILTVVMFFLPAILQKILMGAMWLFSVCGYVQTMFLNKGIDQIGATTDGYIPTTGEIARSAAVWIILLIVGIVLIVLNRKEKWLHIMALTSLVLLAAQGVAYVSLFQTADESAFVYTEGEVTLDAAEQYTVSSEGNVIVLILDTLCNYIYDETAETYPELNDLLADFTYYNNTDCNYWGTFPSIQHIVTGYAFEPETPVNDWMVEGWTNETTTAFYDGLHENGYQVHIYTPENRLVAAGNSMSIMEGKVDNLTTTTAKRSVDHETLYRTLLQMAAYRMMPNYFKPYFDVPNSQYATIVSYPDNQIEYLNPDFYSVLCEEGLSTVDDSKYVVYYHLNGIHELITDENCRQVDESEGTIDGTMRGMWTMLGEYFDQLKAVGAYDNSTIIITADHGAMFDTQSIFFIKEANVTHEEMQTSEAPISLHELMPTIAYNAGLDTANLGDTIYDIPADEPRTRTCLLRGMDESYPSVVRYDGVDNGGANVYFAYTYEGNRDDYIAAYYNETYDVIPAANSFY